MAVNFLASQVPVPQIPTTFFKLEDYNLSSSVPALNSSKSIAEGEIIWANDFNRNAAYLDILAQYGGGMVGIVHGLTITTSSGLVMNVAAGGAVIEGLVQKTATETIVCTAGGNNFVWLKRDGALEVVYNSTTPPTDTSTLLGIVVTNSSQATSFDTSGVCYIRSGLVFRQTADVGTPTDVPSSSWVGITKTLGGSYLFTEEYKRILSPTELVSINPKTTDYSILASDSLKIFTNEGAVAKPVFQLPLVSAGAGPYTYICQDALKLRVQANTADVIRLAGNVSTTSGYAESSAVGDTLTIVGINNSQWFATSYIGTWTVV